MPLPAFSVLDRYREYGAFFIRLAVAARLLYGAQRTVFHPEAMRDFAVWLDGLGFPLPFLAAALTAYAQLLCGLLFLVGAFTRPAAVVMIVNFLVAVLLVHLPSGDTFLDTFDALMMLAASLFFLFNGPGKPSVDRSGIRPSFARAKARME